MVRQQENRRLTGTAVLATGLLVGWMTYSARVHLAGLAVPGPAGARGAEVPLAHLPRPVPLSPTEAEARRLPHRLDGYRLRSVVPAVPGHDLHALYEAEHHISLFLRPVDAPAPSPEDAAHGWVRAAPVAGFTAYQRTTGGPRAALAWIARGSRHVVTGDVPLSRLRHFAEAYEKGQRDR